MTLYVDTSALLKRYVAEAQSDLVDEVLGGASTLVTARHTMVELRRNLTLHLAGAALIEARRDALEDWAMFSIVELDSTTCELAATIAEQTGTKSLDALHLAAARRLGTAVQLFTFDRTQAAAARALGLQVLVVP